MCSMINIVCADLQLGMLVTQVAPLLRQYRIQAKANTIS